MQKADFLVVAFKTQAELLNETPTLQKRPPPLRNYLQVLVLHIYILLL